MTDEGSSIEARWHIQTHDVEMKRSLPPSDDSKTIPLASLDFKDIMKGVSEMKQYINDQMTFWKGAIEGQGETTTLAEDEDQQEDDSE